ncbi:unnamed protein product [Triticum turgidum subsp. durum]|uniref:Disease resistance protein RPM1 n=2 Tax=Triticum TaxID=4564 RepID=A0A9R1B6R1_TRITD|nr:unnamed protein product [Triticum turgidum subsp. durum]
MAEFALGLTKTAVAGTVSKVKSAIEEEEKLRADVEEDLKFITGEFEMMQSFLNSAHTGEHASKNQVARTWVRQLRDLAFEAEDCVEFVVHLDKASRWDWVQRLISPLMCRARPPLPLDEAVAEIKRLKTRVEYVSQRYTRYNFVGTNGGGDGDSLGQQHQLLMHPTAHSTAATAAAFHDLREVWKSMGKIGEHITDDLKRLIDCQGSELQVISLWGSPQADVVGEHGCMSIMKKAYDDPEICQEFKNRAWVKLSVHHPFNPVEFLHNLLTQFTASHHHHHHEDMSELMLQLSKHRYLIFLEEELSSVADWDAIRKCLPDGKRGSRIVVSTKHLKIALVCTGDPYQVSQLIHLSHDRGLYAFFPKGCGHRHGMGEFIWQLRRQGGVIALLEQDLDLGDRSKFMSQLTNDTLNKLSVLNGVKFEYSYRNIRTHGFAGQQNMMVVTMATDILVQSYPKDDQNNAFEQLMGMKHEDVTEKCRKFLTENDYLLFIDEMESHEEWDLINRQLLCESTRACIIVLTKDNSVATYCVDHKEYLLLNLRDLMIKGCDHCGYSDGGDNIKKEGESELDFVGRSDEKDFFYGRTPDVKLLSVWGIAGVGKSAIVWESFHGEVITGGYYKMHSWVDVPHPFNLTDLCRRLLLDFSRDNLEAQETALISMMEGKDPIPGCCKILRQNDCLLVIDGLRSKHDWDLLKAALFSQPVIGRTIVITREESVATYCTNNKKDDILNVKGLKDDVALNLFKKINPGAEELCQSFPEEVQPILKHIMSKCGGLPEVIVAAGKIAGPYSERISSLEFCNAELMEMLEKSLSFPSLKGLFCWMQSYFDACSDELKPCIFYMSVFPVDQSIRRRRLLRRWIAEGYSSGGGGTAEEKGEKLFSELMKLSILYPDQRTSSTARSWMVNGFFCEYIKSRPMEDNLVFALEGSCSPSSRLTGQHLTISSCWDRDEIVFKSMDLSRLRSLTVFGKWVPFLVSDKMKVLRVLDLEGTSSTSDGTASVTDDVLEKIVKQFPRLKFMSLRGCMEVTRLPDSLGDMGQLETLDARHTSIVELPPAVITKLHKLQYIRAGTTEARRLQVAAAAAATTPPPTTQEDVHSGTSPFQRASTRIIGAWNRTAHALVESSSSCSWWESKKQRRRRVRVAANGDGIEVVCAAAEGIGKLTELHTLGVVNIAGGKGGLLLLKELGNLTQLRKLGLSGISSINWKELCNAISGHLPHLESLSLQLLLVEEDESYKFACFFDISMPPKTLKSLKVLYTTAVCAGAFGACIKPAWISQLPNLKKLNHESTVSNQEDIDLMLSNGFPAGLLEKRLRIKPIQQRLSFAKQTPGVVFLAELMIDCGSRRSMVTFGESPNFSVQVVSIHCCNSCDGWSCLQIVGLQNIGALKQVLVTGPCSEEFKEDLRRQLVEREDKPELKLLPHNGDQ